MSKLDQLRALTNEALAKSNVDLTSPGKGGSDVLLPEGYSVARLVEYIEFGMHRKEFNGQLKAPALEFQLGFALYGESYMNGDKPRMIRTYRTGLSNNEKSVAYNMFKLMNYNKSARHFAQLLGESILVKIIHQKAKAGGKLYAKLDPMGFLPPIDPVTRKAYPCPDAPEDMYRLFLWNNPTKESWDSLYIDGIDDNGESKNYLQEYCLKAVDFKGSPLYNLLYGNSSLVKESIVEIDEEDLEEGI